MTLSDGTASAPRSFFGNSSSAQKQPVQMGYDGSPPSNSMNLEVKPYATGAIRTDRDADVPYENDFDPDMGFDVKYGVTKDYIIGLEIVTPTGDIIKTGGPTMKGVVGYDLTKLICGSEGTLAVITKIIVKLLPKPEAGIHKDALRRCLLAGVERVDPEVADELREAFDAVEVRAFLDAGVPVAICTDNTTVSATDLTRETALAADLIGADQVRLVLMHLVQR